MHAYRGRGKQPDWAPCATWDAQQSLWVVRLGDLLRHGELEIGDSVILGDGSGLTIYRGGELDTPAAYGLYFARREGLALHWDGSWSEALLAPGVVRPVNARSMPPRQAFTGIWNSLGALLRQVMDDRGRRDRD